MGLLTSGPSDDKGASAFSSLLYLSVVVLLVVILHWSMSISNVVSIVIIKKDMITALETAVA